MLTFLNKQLKMLLLNTLNVGENMINPDLLDVDRVARLGLFETNCILAGRPPNDSWYMLMRFEERTVTNIVNYLQNLFR